MSFSLWSEFLVAVFSTVYSIHMFGAGRLRRLTDEKMFCRDVTVVFFLSMWIASYNFPRKTRDYYFMELFLWVNTALIMGDIIARSQILYLESVTGCLTTQLNKI